MQIKPNYIKLGMNLDRSIDRDSVKQVMISRMYQLAHQHGVHSVVEGIVCQGEFDREMAHGESFLQGYHIARPFAIVELCQQLYGSDRSTAR